MVFLSQALEWVRAVPFGPRTPGRHRRVTTPGVARPAPPHRLSPDVWGARLVTARSHRRKRYTSTVHEPGEHTGALVRPYVAHLGASVLADAQAGTWGDAR
ncbi:hypothetical protein GCM10027072_02760 [Streptomyces bullii]